MNEFTILSKSKSELLDKVNYLIGDNEIDEKNKVKLFEWRDWFIQNKDKINLETLVNSEYFYRAYWNTANNLFGIQIWKEIGNDMVSWEHNLYVNKSDILDDDQTIIIG